MRFRFDMYSPGDTPVHRCDARVKIVLLIVFSIAALAVRTWWGIGVLTCLLALVWVLARLSGEQLARSLAPVCVFVLLAIVFALIADPSLSGLLSGLLVGARLLLLAAGSFAVCLTAASTQLVDALRSLMQPLRAARVPVDDVAFTLSLALRFLPVIGAEVLRIRAAQDVRGAALPTGLMRRLRRIAQAFVSVFVGVFRRADILSQAMDARCYGAASRRSALTQQRFSPSSAAVLVCGGALLLATCIFL